MTVGAPFVTTSMEDGSPPWTPWFFPLETSEFVALTGFINAVGWGHVTRQIRKIRSSRPIHGLILISRTGLCQQPDTGLVRKLHEFALEFHLFVRVYVYPDHRGQQMHAKALACLLTGGEAITRIGSANMTAAGLARNKEIEAVLAGVEPYDQVRAAARSLTRVALNLADLSTAMELSIAVQEAQPSAPSAEPSAVGSPGSDEDQRAYSEAQAWLSGGLRLSAQHQNDEFAVSFPLNHYIQAHLIKHGGASDEATGIRVAADRKSIHIPLLPEPQKKALKELNQQLGTILSRYAVPMAGVSWCRVEWMSALRREWRKAVGAVNHAALEKELGTHVALLRVTMLREDEHWYAVAKLFQHHQPMDWDQDAAKRLLGVEAVERCLRDPEQAQNTIAAVVLEAVYETVSRHLNIEYLQALIRNVGEGPHEFPHEPDDRGSVFEAILDLLGVGLLPILRCGGEWKARSNGLLGRVLLERFSSLDPIALHTKMLHYKRSVSEYRNNGSLPMAALWATFRETYQLVGRPIDWRSVVQSEKRPPSEPEPADMDGDAD